MGLGRSVPATLLAAACLAGCAEAAGNVPPLAPRPSASAADQADLERVVGDYVQARVAAVRDGFADVDRLEEVLTPELAQDEVRRLDDLVGRGLVRGEQPSVDGVEADVVGDQAVVVACLDQDDWAVVPGDQEVSASRGSVAWGAKAVRGDDDRWRLDRLLPVSDQRVRSKPC